ncbi:nuclear transport factor 2 family protein [Actinorugispora endophytica]|uniref:SnoaL-like protein n=1 Tax=Actinorugispora endophytica TaxID=1605990 RepID=A0A4V3D788_9ACTN|nr:nuclear transport factor 2 family protein [Actinorugispora endophytica]TDQ46907.1 SnoaL-like protein [Actinorugispora endophytica]
MNESALPAHRDPAEAARELFRRHTAALAARDLDRVVANYEEDAVIVRFDTVARGRAEIRAFFDRYLALDPEPRAAVAVNVTEDVVTYHVRLRLDGEPVDGFGTLVLRNGRFWRQTAAFVPAVIAGSGDSRRGPAH